MVALYYTVGAAAYQFLENWNVVDSLYFLTVTATTVGYGDLAPVTHLGRVFTSIYSILGITIAFDQIVSVPRAGGDKIVCFGVELRFSRRRSRRPSRR